MPRPTIPAEELAYYRAHFREAVREDGVVCLECGGVYKGLSNHPLWRHGLSVDDYREKWGYNRTRGLVSTETRELMRQRAIARGMNVPPDAILRAQEAIRRFRPPARPETPG